MALVTKNDVTQIFAIQAPEVDLPPTFANYPRGWDTARSNNGKPTIKQFNYLQQRTDQNVLWMHQNGSALPYDATMEYAEGAVVVKDGELQKKQGTSWVFAANKGYNLDYFASGKSYPLHAEIMLTNGDTVKSTVANNTVNPNVDMTGWIFDATGQKSSDAKNILEFSSVIKLREYEPRAHGDKVYLTGLNEGSELGFGDWYYDETDTTSADNGWFIVVTSNGKRLKRVGLQSAINLDWAGIHDQGDLAVKWQEAINFSDSIRTTKTHIFNCPKIIINGQRYTMSTGVIHPAYLSTEFSKSCLITVAYARSSCAYVLALRNASNTQGIYRVETQGVRWNHTLTCVTGKVKFVFENNDPLLSEGSTRPSCLVSGNTTATTYAYQCNMRVSNIEAYGFRAAHEVLGLNSWGYRFENCGFGGGPRNGQYSVWTSSTTNSDSGERCSYVNCFMSGIRLSTPSMYMYFDCCSMDFSYDDVLSIDSTAEYCDIRFTNSHIENFNAFVVNSALTVAKATNMFVTFSGGRILPTSFERECSHDIILFNGHCNILLTDGVILENSIYPQSNNLGASLGLNGAIVRSKNTYTKDQRPRINGNLSKISIANDFLTDAIDAVVNTSTPSVNFEITLIGAGLTASIKASPETSSRTLALVSSATNGFVVLRSTKFTNVQAGRRYTCRPVIEVVDADSLGTPKHVVFWFDADKILIGTSKPPYDINITSYISGAIVPFLSRQTKRIPIVHVDYTAPAGAVYAKQGFEMANTISGKTYYLHSVELHDAIVN